MSYQVLARKWRPRNFAELVGQEHVVQALVNALDADRLHHAFLFTGTRGVGKTTIARILAKSLNCETGVSSTPCGRCSACLDIDAGRYVDLLEIDGASKTKVEDTRDVLENVIYAPARGKYKVYLIDEVHMLSTSSFNALLKTLEEPPPHVKFLLATTDPQKLPVTVLSRCLQFSLRRLTPEQIRGQMQRILEAEQLSFDTAALDQLATAADGSLRDGLSLLDQSLAFGAGALRDDDVRTMLGTLDRERVLELVSHVVQGDAGSLLRVIADLDQYSIDFRRVAEELARVFHRIAVAQAVGPEDAEPELVALADAMLAEQVQLYYQMAIIGARDMNLAPSPRLGLEMLLLRMLAFRPAGPADVEKSGGSAHSGGERGTVPSGGMAGASTSELPARPAPPASAASPPRPQAPSPASHRPMPVLESAQRSDSAAISVAPAATVVTQPSPPRREQVVTNEVADGLRARLGADCSWEAQVVRLDLRGLARELAVNLSPPKILGDVWASTLAPEQEYLLSESNLQALRDALAAELGKPVHLNVSTAVPNSESAATPAQRQTWRQSMARAEAEHLVNSDPVIQGLIQELGARVIPGSIQAIQERDTK